MSTASPLQEVERAVQERAKAVSLDMGSPEAAARLRGLVDEEVARWSDDFKRGLRSFDIADRELVAERAFRNVAGYGPLEPLLADDDVWAAARVNVLAAAGAPAVGPPCKSGGIDKHHTVPSEILKKLPPDVANNPAVRGRAGAPNRWPLPTSLHKRVHGKGGGPKYNTAWKAELR